MTRLACLFSLVLLGGCAGFSNFNSDDIRGRDRNGLQTSARLALDVWDVRARREDGRDGGGPVQAPWGPVSIEFSVDAASGDFTSPATASWSTTDYDLLEVAAAARSGTVFGASEKLMIRGLLGVGFHHGSFDVAIPSQPNVTRDSNRVGVVTGAEIGYRPVDALRLYGRSTIFLGLDAYSQKAEAGLEVELADSRIFVYAGWRHWTFERDDLSLFSGSNNIDLRSQGLLLGLGMRF